MAQAMASWPKPSRRRRARVAWTSRPSASPPARVLVVGIGAVAELAMLRGLRSAGYEPWTVTWNPSGPAARSRSACGVISAPSPSREPERLAQVVADCARRLQAAAVLPCVDAALIALSDAADRYPSGVIPGCASP